MDKLTAVRTFGNPGYSPAKRVRIFADRWYRVRMQNVEHGQGDYVGLGEGEYTELLPGKDARARRDAHLNHCNSILEYSGEVYQLKANRYSGEIRHSAYFPSKEIAENRAGELRAQHDKWILDCLRERDMHLAASISGAKSIMTPEHHAQVAADCLRVVEQHRDSFRYEVVKVK